MPCQLISERDPGDDARDGRARVHLDHSRPGMALTFNGLSRKLGRPYVMDCIEQACRQGGCYPSSEGAGVSHCVSHFCQILCHLAPPIDTRCDLCRLCIHRRSILRDGI